jgi:hypothetical protein
MKPGMEKAKKASDHSTRCHWNEMNRQQRRDMMRKTQSDDLNLEVLQVADVKAHWKIILTRTRLE